MFFSTIEVAIDPRLCSRRRSALRWGSRFI